jgi:uncharacterized protein (PEP-CTERM system associated)
VLALSAGGALAQADAGGSGGRAYYMTAGLSAGATFTDNANLSATNKQSDLFLSVTPSIQIGGQTGRLRGNLSYALTASYSVNDAESSTWNNFLSAQGTAEVIENRFFVDATASISQQFISPFGQQNPDPALNNPNSTQVTTLSVAPYLKGQIAGEVDYNGRAFYTTTFSGSSQAADSSTFGGILSFNGSTRWSRLGWGLNFSYREINFNPGRDTFDQLNWVALKYSPFAELQFTLRGNAETSNVTSINTETHYGYGGGVIWRPSPRTDLTVEYDTRVFGSSHLYAFNYRTAQTVWSISSRQGLSTGQNLGGDLYGQFPRQTTAYDLLFAQFASIQPDPVLRAQLVNAFLKANGIDPNATLTPNYLPSQVTEELSNNASVAWLGKRSSVILSANQTKSRNLGPLSNPDNDFANANQVDWLSFSVTGSHRLTPLTSLSASLTQSRTSGDENGLSTTLWSGMLMLTTQLAERVSASVSVRRNVFQSSTAPYTENAVLATIGMQF